MTVMSYVKVLLITLLVVITCFTEDVHAHGKVGCRRLQRPYNGRLTCSGRMIGDQCRCKCHGSYILSGSLTRVCQSNGRWSGQESLCEHCVNCEKRREVSCPSINAPNGGSTEGLCNPGRVGSTCSFYCSNDLVMDGRSSITCQSNGQWDGRAPSCRRFTNLQEQSRCQNLNPPQGGRLQGSCSNAVQGDSCQVVCDNGYRPSDNRILVCQQNGVWSDSLPNCFGDSGCSTLYPPENGMLSGSCSSASVEQNCNFNCRQGFVLRGQQTLICQPGGSWSAQTPTCNRGSTMCNNLQSPRNGYTVGTCASKQVGDQCEFGCENNYVLQGQRVLNCQNSGNWNNNVPTCQRRNTMCDRLNAPQNGYISGTYSSAQVGDTCQFGCDNNCVLQGQRVLKCQSSGNWNANPPTCQRGESESCQSLHPPAHGDFVECDNRSGGRCVVVCHQDYQRSGSRVRTCLSQGLWSGNDPQCNRRNNGNGYQK